MTKREYAKALAALIERRTMVRIELDALMGRYLFEKPPAHIENEWNGLHDLDRDIGQDIEHLDRQYRRRKWTYSDHAAFDLVCQNID